MMTRMKLGRIAILLLVQLMCCCGKPDTGIIITPPNPKPDSGQQGGGSGSGSGSGGGSGTETPPPTQPKDGYIIVGYATYWDKTMPDPTYLTHINYAFAHIKNDFQSLDIKNETRLAQGVFGLGHISGPGLGPTAVPLTPLEGRSAGPGPRHK